MKYDCDTCARTDCPMQTQANYYQLSGIYGAGYHCGMRIEKVKRSHPCIEHDLSGGIHELKNKSDELQKKYELAAACIGGVSNTLQSGASDAPQSAMARIRDYYNDLEVVEKEVAS